MRRVAAASSVAEAGEMVGMGGSAEKLVAEALWLAQKMAESGAATEAVARWGATAGLGRLALSVEPRLQVALVRVSARQKLIEGDDGDCGGVPMFRTGSERSVSVSESSIRKAHTVTLALCLPHAVFFEVGASLLFGFFPAVLYVFSAKVIGASLSF